MITAAVVICWGVGVISNTPLVYLTSAVVSGQCIAVAFFPSAASMIGYGVAYFFFLFFGPLILFVYCYGHIVFIIRKQVKVHSVQAPAQGLPVPTNSAQKNAARSQMNVIKVMIIVNVFFVLCWMPNQVYYILLNLQVPLNLLNDTWYILEAMVLFNVGINPFIYASQFDIIKNHISNAFSCLKHENVDHTAAELRSMA